MFLSSNIFSAQQQLTTNIHTHYYLAIILFYSLLSILSVEVPFFWDNVLLVSKAAHFYYDTQFNHFFLPLSLDTGHPPFYGMYMAVWWLMLGKSLSTSHMAVWPFLVIMGISYYHIARYFVPKQQLPFALLLLFIEPNILSQSVLAGIDISLLSLYLLGLYSIIYDKRKLLSVALLLMAAISLRGIIAVGLLGISDVLWQYSRSLSIKPRDLLSKMLVYIPVSLAVISYYYYHYQHTGFIAQNYNSGRAKDYAFVTLPQFIWHMTVILWRILDHGRIVLHIVALWAIYTCWRYTTFSTKQKQLLAISLIPLIVYALIIGLRANAIAHRYLMAFYVLFSIILLSYWASLRVKNWIKNMYMFLISFSLLSGHLYVYPQPIASGWDVLLSSLRYFDLQHTIIEDIKHTTIPFNTIGTEFPITAPLPYTHLHLSSNMNHEAYDVLFTKPLSAYTHILYSNVINDFSQAQLDTLATWHVLKHWENWPVYSTLYENPMLFQIK